MPFDLTPVHLALSAVAFAAGFVDAVAGGGGMLTVPSLLLAMPDARIVLGTNKAQSVWGTAAATLAFARAGALDRSRAGVTFVAAAFGSWLGALGVARLRPELLRPVVLVLPRRDGRRGARSYGGCSKSTPWSAPCAAGSWCCGPRCDRRRR